MTTKQLMCIGLCNTLQNSLFPLKTGTETVRMIDLAKGTHLLRLISADDTRTEKIVKY